MIKMKLYCNIYNKFTKAAECADYLVKIASLEDPDSQYMWYITKPIDTEVLKPDIAVKNPCVL
jgi:hypothetical protein